MYALLIEKKKKKLHYGKQEQEKDLRLERYTEDGEKAQKRSRKDCTILSFFFRFHVGIKKQKRRRGNSPVPSSYVSVDFAVRCAAWVVCPPLKRSKTWPIAMAPWHRAYPNNTIKLRSTPSYSIFYSYFNHLIITYTIPKTDVKIFQMLNRIFKIIIIKSIDWIGEIII